MNNQERILEVIRRIKENRAVAKSIRESIRSECQQSKSYQESADTVIEHKEKMKRVMVAVASPKDLEQLENLKAEIKNDQQVLTDIAMSAFMKGDNIEIDGEEGERYTPVFKVNFQMTLL